MILDSILIAIGLAMDALAVSLCIGAGRCAGSPRSKFRLAFHFGLFQGGMTLLGWLAGSTIVFLISSWDHWIAFGLLAYVGIHMIISGFKPEKETFPQDPSKGGMLVLLSVATSLDALAVGLSLAVIGSPVVVPSLIIGGITFGLSLLGLLFGDQLGHAFGKRMELVGGIILVGIGIRVLLTHIL